MRIVVISDTHSLHQFTNPPEGDILIHAGDITRKGKIEELEKFNAWLGTLKFRHKLVIAGNHDFCFEKDKARSIEVLTNATYLEDSGLTIDGVNFYGSPWQPEFYNFAFNLPRGAPLKAKWDLIPESTDVLITHGPPYGQRDQIVGGERVGCEELTKALQRLRPAACLFGHIHENYGVSWLGETLCVNASFVDREYDFGSDEIVFDLIRTGNRWKAQLAREVRSSEIRVESSKQAGAW